MSDDPGAVTITDGDADPPAEKRGGMQRMLDGIESYIAAKESGAATPPGSRSVRRRTASTWWRCSVATAR